LLPHAVGVGTGSIGVGTEAIRVGCGGTGTIGFGGEHLLLIEGGLARFFGFTARVQGEHAFPLGVLFLALRFLGRSDGVGTGAIGGNAVSLSLGALARFFIGSQAGSLGLLAFGIFSCERGLTLVLASLVFLAAERHDACIFGA
jgi:hypothetical protein